jgi:biotin transport system substrate-specific component
MNHTSKLALTGPFAFPGTTIAAQAFWIAAFAGLTALGARLEIPHYPVPYTLQTLVVLLAGAFLGPRNGAISQISYLAAGLLGAPVFAGGAAGLAPFIGPTGGYLLGFPLGAAVAGLLLTRGTSLVWAFISMGAGLAVIFLLGTLHLYAFALHDLTAAISSGFLIFSWWDMLKLGAAAMSYHAVRHAKK